MSSRKMTFSRERRKRTREKQPSRERLTCSRVIHLHSAQTKELSWEIWEVTKHLKSRRVDHLWPTMVLHKTWSSTKTHSLTIQVRPRKVPTRRKIWSWWAPKLSMQRIIPPLQRKTMTHWLPADTQTPFCQAWLTRISSFIANQHYPCLLLSSKSRGKFLNRLLTTQQDHAWVWTISRHLSLSLNSLRHLIRLIKTRIPEQREKSLPVSLKRAT